MTGNGEFGPMAQGLEFLQGMMKSAGSAVPGLGPWMAPTLDPEELDKRITDLRTVQFWLEQNAKLIATTIQALEVQRMTLATLKGMNVSMADLGEAFRMRDAPQGPASEAPAPAPAAAEPAPPRRRSSASRQAGGGKAAPAVGAASPVADPMAWWTTLTQQFTELASKAVRDSAAATAAGADPAAASAAPAAGAKAGKRAPARPARKTSRAAPRKR